VLFEQLQEIYDLLFFQDTDLLEELPDGALEPLLKSDYSVALKIG
jgi:hypothetical protein